MPAPTDYHEQVRDAVATALTAALTGYDFDDLTAKTVDDVDDAAKLALPCVAVCCVGPEIDREEMSTNQRDGIGYPIAVLLLTNGTSRGEKTPGPPGLTLFRRIVKNAFHMQRLSGVAEVGWCEVTDSGPLVDDKSPAFQKLQTALVVEAVGRFPRS